MVKERETDGIRLAQLLASELEGHEQGPLGPLVVTNAVAAADLRPLSDLARAYDVERDGERIARVFVHPDRAHVEFEVGLDAVVASADEANLRVRPKATEPPKALVFIEDGAQVKWILDVFAAAVEA
ncbi:hypothetical protein [Haladaptatus sp. DYSN1]|uniref:hypothetical protein n=1 Tax=unclassified Haladaptatus TaxID=2622732 RepID=UPI002404E9F2|nr:hypothetical protein [Haladaptatus sp. DYSN1]